MIDRPDAADALLSFSVIHATPPRTATPCMPRVTASYSPSNSSHGSCTRSAHQSRRSLVMQRTHSHYTVREDFASLQNIDARGETTLGERRLRKLEGFVLRAAITTSYGGAWLIEALMLGARRAFTVRANQGRSF